MDEHTCGQLPPQNHADLTETSQQSDASLSSAQNPEQEDDHPLQGFMQIDDSDSRLENSSALRNRSETVQKTALGSRDAHDKPETGVLYISRIPPGMDTTCVRALLSRIGRVNRIWLRPHTASSTTDSDPGLSSSTDVKKMNNNQDDEIGNKRKKRNNMNRRRALFRDGWVEFIKRRDAKRAVGLLNGQAMSNRGKWAGDLWTIRLLRGFTWADLMREVFGAPRERVKRAVAEVADARSEKAWIEKSVALGRRVERRPERESKRMFRQRGVVRMGEGEKEEEEDERRAREAGVRVDREVEHGTKRRLDEDLVGMLFKKQRSATLEE